MQKLPKSNMNMKITKKAWKTDIIHNKKFGSTKIASQKNKNIFFRPLTARTAACFSKKSLSTKYRQFDQISSAFFCLKHNFFAIRFQIKKILFLYFSSFVFFILAIPLPWFMATLQEKKFSLCQWVSIEYIRKCFEKCSCASSS